MSPENEVKIEEFLSNLDEVAMMRFRPDERYELTRNIVGNLLAQFVYVEEVPDGVA